LFERVARARLCRLWPEESEELISTTPALASGRECREQCQSAAVMSMSAEDRDIPRPRERERAEGRQTIASDRMLGHRRLDHTANLTAEQEDSKKLEG
jgi:hypothetical protein